jgi:histidinol-phosphatase (PHP family)
MRLASYHVHTDFCDGKNTCEEMVLAGIDLGMTDIGFSAHAAWPVATEWHMDTLRFPEYLAEVSRVAKKYGSAITIRTGFEADWIPGITAPDSAFYGQFGIDYLIGSVHYACTDVKGRIIPPWSVDAPVETCAKGIADAFDGDGKRAARAYWQAVRDMVSSCDFDIIGHVDLLRKRNNEIRFFDETESWYRRELRETAKTIAKSGKIVELNTGAIARKAMDAIYPSDEFLSLLCRAGVPVTPGSDAHATADLVGSYDRAKEAAKKAGYGEFMYKNDSGWAAERFF